MTTPPPSPRCAPLPLPTLRADPHLYPPPQGKPFMEPLSANKGLAGSLSMAAVSLLFLIKRWDGDVIGEMLELVPLGEEAQSQLLGIIASDFVGCLLLEKATAAIFRY